MTADRLKAFGKVAKRIEGWQPASEALTAIESVRTVFPGLNAATRVGGWPLSRIGLVHGPSAHGKTQLVLGLGLSFLRAGHFFFFVDAEMSTPRDWVEKLLGEHAGNPAFLAKRPSSYEETVDLVRRGVTLVAEAREAGDLPPDTTALVVVDSIRKLVPQRILEKLQKSAESEGVDGISGRAGQLRAALNAAWMDELVPLLNHTRASLVLVARERDNADAGKYDDDYLITGGRAVQYDSSLTIRVERAAWVKNKAEEIVGERHRGTIRKSRVAGKDDRASRFYFHTSNGREEGVAEGFDYARDLLEIAKVTGVVAVAGSTFSHGERKFRGEAATLKALREEPELYAAVEQEATAKHEPEAAEPETP